MNPGEIYISGDYLYFIDNESPPRMWRYLGTSTGASGQTPGSMRINSATNELEYVDSSGLRRSVDFSTIQADSPEGAFFLQSSSSLVRWIINNSSRQMLHNDVNFSNVPHSDATHADVAEVPFTNTHSDVTFVDTHSDIAFSNAHSNTAFSNAHSNVAFSNAHSNVGFVNTHSDVGFVNTHSNVGFVNTHSNVGFVNTHSNVGFVNTHSNVGFSNAHSNTSHSNVAFANTHSNTSHSNVSFSNTHSNVSHANSHGNTTPPPPPPPSTGRCTFSGCRSTVSGRCVGSSCITA